MKSDTALHLLYAAPGLVLRPGCGPCEHFLSVARGLARHPGVRLQVLIGNPSLPGLDPQAAGVPDNCELHLLPLPRDAWAVIDSLALGSHPLRYLQHYQLVQDAIRRICADGAPGAVVERMWGFGGILGSTLKRDGSAWIIEENGPPGFEFRKKRLTDVLRGAYLGASRLRTRMMYRRSARVIVQTEALRDRLLEQFGAPRERLEVIPNAVDRQLLTGEIGGPARTAARQRLGLPQEDALLLYCGSLDRNHHVRRVVEAFLTAQRPAGSARLLVLGMGYDRHAIEDVVREDARRRGAPSDVQVLEPQPRAILEDYLRAADLALAPYDKASFPQGRFGFSSLKVREYLAYELPVAATAGTAAGLIQHDVNGFLLEDDAGWRELFSHLPARSRLHEMGVGSRQRVSGYTYDHVAERYVGLARQILGGVAPVRAPLPA